MDSELLDSLSRLLAFLFAWLGPGGTILAVVGIFFALAIRRVYLDQRADKYLDRLLEEKERTIQRLATQERQGRIHILMLDLNLTQEEAERIIAQNDFSTPLEAREALERPRRRLRE